jgi:hypothetical protein
MIHEFDVVALTIPLPDNDLVAGDTGAVVDIHRDPDGTPDGYTVEIIRGGKTIAVVPLLPDHIRLVHHYRPIPAHSTIKA